LSFRSERERAELLQMFLEARVKYQRLATATDN
jgi:hypothetical protein